MKMDVGKAPCTSARTLVEDQRNKAELGLDKKPEKEQKEFVTNINRMIHISRYWYGFTLEIKLVTWIKYYATK